MTDDKATWTQGATSKDWHGQYRGLTVRIVVSPSSAQPNLIKWFIAGRLTETAPGECTSELAKVISCQVIDQMIAEDPVWAAAERRHNRERLSRR